jgi:Ca-activated chloride channel family protein
MMQTERKIDFRAGLIAVFLIGLQVLFFGVFRSHAAGLLIADGGFGGRMEIVEHDVKVTINNGIAVTEVNQVFKNLENRQVEALYTFPVPKGASVSNFSMWIGGKEMIGEVLEKQRARDIYNSYKRKRRDPGLLEQTDFKTFEMRIFPIAPRAEQRVQVTYYQELDFDHDWATYVYPLASTTENKADTKVKGKFAVSVDLKSSVPIIETISPSHGDDFLTIIHDANFQEASLENRDGDLARDVVLSFHAARPQTGLDLITSNQPGEDGYFMMTLTAGQELEKQDLGADYVFVLDISGSMADSGKLRTSRASIEAFVTSLGGEDKFELITFNRQARPLFGTLTGANEESRQKAVSFLASQEAKGGTVLQSALSTAYQYGNPDRPINVVILSDGMTEQAERRVLMEMIQNRPANMRVFCIGVGNEVNRPLLKQMAEDAGGLAAFISRGDDFTRQAQAFRRKLTHPVARNLSLQVSDLDVYDVEPQKLPNLYHGMPIRIFGRYRGEGTAQLALHGEVNGREFTTKAELLFPAEDGDNPEIERMWAYHRMQSVEKEMQGTNDQAAIDEIVRLGEAYSITSRYTSFIVLENDAEYKRWNIERRNALRIGRDREAQARVRAELETLRRQAANNIGPAGQTKQQTVTEPAKPLQVASRVPVQQPVNSSGTKRQSFDLPSMGGGALDPLSVLSGLGLVGAAALARRKKK